MTEKAVSFKVKRLFSIEIYRKILPQYHQGCQC